MFCCRARRCNGEKKSSNSKNKDDRKNESANDVSNNNIPLSIISNGSISPQSTKIKYPEENTHEPASRSSSISSFYSVKSNISNFSKSSSGTKDADFYSVCSDDSFKSS